ncbi:hypothetical protein Pelo_18910 [Pelomyxa schiedti]|nr:hypothetical protein Pelo_18910 [Pelomyxa schiedti]
MAATMMAVNDFVIETVRMCANGNFKEAIPRCNEMLLTELSGHSADSVRISTLEIQCGLDGITGIRQQRSYETQNALMRTAAHENKQENLYTLTLFHSFPSVGLYSLPTEANTAGNYLLGVIYSLGVGVDKDTTLAAEYFRKGVSQGSVLSMRNLALCYLKGNGVPKNEIEAFRLFKMGASMNSAPCQTEVATCLETGEGVGQDITEAVRMYSVAAQQVFC